MKGRVGILSSARHAVVVPALHAGDLALIQVRHGTAWTVATELTASGATDVLSLDSIDVVTARITTDSLARIASEPAVPTATTDTRVAATSGRRTGRP